MNPTRRPAHAIAALLLSGALAAQISAYHEATSAQHQTHVQNLSNNGYRMISLSIYGTVASPRYAAVWVQRQGPTFLPFQDLTAQQYQNFVTSNQANYAPTIVTAMGTAGNERFAGVLEQTGYGLWALHGLGPIGMRDAVQAARDANWRLRSADVYGSANDPRFVVTFQPNPQQVGWGYYTAAGAQDHQDKFDGLSEAYCRPILAAFNDDSSQFLCAWEDTVIPGGPVHHGMTVNSYNTLANQYWTNNSQYPIHVGASGSGNGAQFAAIFSTTDVPQARQWTVTGTAVPQLQGFDNFMQTLMQNGGVRGAQLAIVKDGKLKYARGYTWAEPGYTAITPTSLFRIASCTKPLTSIAIHRAIAKNPNMFNYGTSMVSQFPFSNYADPNNSLTTVLHLLRHRGGWDRVNGNGGNAYDPMFIDWTIDNQPGVSVPISITDIRNFMDAQPLDFVPGNIGVYSNYGYCLLGRIVERRNPGKTYLQVIDEQIFQPLGITRAQLGRSRRNQRLPGEVLYHPRTLSVRTSVVDATPTFVPNHYGGWNQENMDSHGAYVMAAPDFAKVLAAFDLGVFNPILHPAQTAAMWNQTGTSTTLQGWFLTNVNNGLGGTIAMRDHNGSLPGTRTYIARRADGLSFVVFTNGDRDLLDVDGIALNNIANMVSLWPAHDLFPSVGINTLQQINEVLSPVGSSCPGGTATAMPVFSGSGVPTIGSRVVLNLANVAPNSALLLGVGSQSARIDLGPYGAPGCMVYMTPEDLLPMVASTAGTAAVVIDIPLDPALVGMRRLLQFGILNTAANSLGAHVSNALDVQVGGWLGM